MAYVDLNPIRAGIAATPEESDHTSIKQRIEALQSASETRNAVAHQPVGLELFVGNPRQPMPAGLAYRLEDYLKLVDWTGRHIREDKRGRIEDEVPPILNRLGIASAHWLYRSISRSTMKVVSSRWWEVYERPVNRWAGRKVIVYRRARCCLGDGGGSVSRKSQ